MHIDLERLIHSLKTAIACSIAFLFTQLLGTADDPWIVITVIVVMCAQIYVGSVLQKGYLRFLGTFIGCLLATITLLSFGHSPLVIITTVALASFFFSYIATGTESLSYAGTLGAVTTTIILIGQVPTPLVAGQRFLEITLGILIATFVSQFILPIQARTHLRRAQIATLQQMHDCYAEIMTKDNITTKAHYLELDQSIITALVRQQKLAKESAHELFGEKFNSDYFLLTLQCEREMLRAISFMHHAIIEIHTNKTTRMYLPALDAFNTHILTSINTLIAALKTNNPLTLHLLAADLEGLRDALMTNTDFSSEHQAIYVDGFLFSADILNSALEKLAGLFGVITYEIKKQGQV